jgi:hypothetical protein
MSFRPQGETVTAMFTSFAGANVARRRLLPAAEMTLGLNCGQCSENPNEILSPKCHTSK